jgi:hypothetical protein
VIFLPPQAVSNTDDEKNALQDDQRLNQTVSWQGTHQPVRRVLESLSAQLKIPLRAESKTASLRLTASGSPRTAREFMRLIAQTLNAKWQRNGLKP